jgi:PD-(D/E)XK nuclease superfamily protein
MLGLRTQRNSKIQGNIGLATAILWFEQNGYPTYIPLTDSQEDDLVVRINGKLCGVQVKTTYHKTPSGSYEVNLRVSGGNRSGTGKIKHFDPSEVDYLFVVTDTNEKYLIPSVHIDARRAITLWDKYAQYRVE